MKNLGRYEKYMGVSEVEVLVDDEDERRDGKGGKEA
jgi:hypothetical protein